MMFGKGSWSSQCWWRFFAPASSSLSSQGSLASGIRHRSGTLEQSQARSSDVGHGTADTFLDPLHKIFSARAQAGATVDAVIDLIDMIQNNSCWRIRADGL